METAGSILAAHAEKRILPILEMILAEVDKGTGTGRMDLNAGSACRVGARLRSRMRELCYHRGLTPGAVLAAFCKHRDPACNQSVGAPGVSPETSMPASTYQGVGGRGGLRQKRGLSIKS